jgi:biopolymer transport protein ExbB
MITSVATKLRTATVTMFAILICSSAFAQAPSPDTLAATIPESVSLLPRDLSPWGMFMHADILVKFVMVGLAIASFVTWTVCLAKAIELWFAKRRVYEHLRILAKARTLAEAGADHDDPVTKLILAAEHEIEMSRGLPGEGVKERIASQLERIEVAASRHIGRSMGILASIGAVAPFVGLFGTVWGIMNSFIGISKAHTTNLAVVAPGIAEALLATALGLAAAIPAVVIYNMFTRSITRYRLLLADASARVMQHVSRDLDRKHMTLPRAAE